MQEKLLIGKSSDKLKEYRKSIEQTSEKLTSLLFRLREIVKVDTADAWQDILSGATLTRSELKANIETELSQISIPVFRDEMKVKMDSVVENFEELVNKVANSFNLNPSFIPRSFYQLSKLLESICEEPQVNSKVLWIKLLLGSVITKA